jgi:hypothetical protein
MCPVPADELDNYMRRAEVERQYFLKNIFLEILTVQ